MAGLEVLVRVPLRGFRLDLELGVGEGERLALVGPSGAGKTTTLRAIAGLARPDAGRIVLGSTTWFDAARGIDRAPEERRCGYVFQDYALFPRMSAVANVAYGVPGGSRKDRRRLALDLMERFGIEDLADAPTGDLSGGERQRVALARALAPGPAALLLDEPLSALDPSTRTTARAELDSMLGGLGIPIVLVTHSFEDAALLAGSVAVLERGRVVQVGSPADVSARPASAFVAGFAGASVLIGEAAPDADGLTAVHLGGGGIVRSTDPGRGPVSVSVFPWEVSLEAPGEDHPDSALNRLSGEVTSVTEVGNRARIGVAVPEPLSAEITGRSVASLGLAPGKPVVASWKATATRLAAR